MFCRGKQLKAEILKWEVCNSIAVPSATVILNSAYWQSNRFCTYLKIRPKFPLPKKPVPFHTDTKYPIECAATWGSSARACKSTRDQQPRRHLTQVGLQLPLKPCATTVGTAAPENPAAFSYLPPLIPAGMQHAASYVLLKGKLASSLPNNSDEMYYFSR